MAVTSLGNFRQTVVAALVFWLVCLVLTAFDSSVGDNWLSKGLFLLSIPMLVIALFWTNRSLLRSGDRWIALATMAVSVFVYASVILLIGLFAASTFKAYLLAP